jgi:putative ABC transport system ATP-binding protein
MLSFRPQTLLLDEPTSALDNTTAHTVLENALAFCRQEKINTVIISHANEIIEKFAENVIVLSKGS